MIIVGAGGLAKEVLEIIYKQGKLDKLAFYDDINIDQILVFDRFPILHSIEDVIKHFESQNQEFTIGIGRPHLRKMLAARFCSFGGKYTSTISLKADIGSFGVLIGAGANILDGAKISNNVVIGQGALIYYNAIITHDCVIGDFVEISPAATLLGGVKVGDLTHIGAGAVVLPGVKIGSNVIVGAGAVVTNNVDDNTVVIGVPAKKLIRK